MIERLIGPILFFNFKTTQAYVFIFVFGVAAVFCGKQQYLLAYRPLVLRDKFLLNILMKTLVFFSGNRRTRLPNIRQPRSQSRRKTTALGAPSTRTRRLSQTCTSAEPSTCRLIITLRHQL